MSVATLFRKRLASSHILHVVENTRGLKVAFSTSITLALYVLFFSSSCFLDEASTI